MGNHWVSAGFARQTITERYATVGGFTHGFDYLRLILAAAVVFQHSFVSSYGAASDAFVWANWHRIFFAPILLMFFALSGFLVAGSLKKNPTVTSFATLRAVRLIPALAVEILLSALVLGPLLTTLPLPEYFSDKRFLAYFGNMLGIIKMFLPDVFIANPFSGIVNVSLWTVPYELECYLVLIALWLAGFVKRRWPVVIIAGAFVAIGTVYALLEYEPSWASNRPLPRALLAAFLSGLILNLYAERIQLDWRIALLALIGMVATTLTYQTVYLAAVFAAYLVVYVGMMHPPKRSFLFGGDYSYGLYLFAFPIQQTYTLLFPGYRHWYLNLAFALVFGLIYAAFSWWFIEKPILGRKRQWVGWIEKRTGSIEKRINVRRFSR